MQKLDPIEINETNGIKEWYEETRVGQKNGHNRSYAKAGNLPEIEVQTVDGILGIRENKGILLILLDCSRGH